MIRCPLSMVVVMGWGWREANCQIRPSLIFTLTAKGVPAKQTSETSDHLVLHSLIRTWFRSPGQGFRPLPRALVAAAAAYPAASQSPEASAPPFQIRGAGRGGERDHPLLASPRCLIPRTGGLEQGRTLPRKSRLPASPSLEEGKLRKGAGRRSGRAATAGICLDLTTLSTRAQTQGNLEKALLSLARSPREPRRAPQPRGEGKGRRGPRLLVDATPLLVYALHSLFPSRAEAGGGGVRGCAPTLLRLARSSDAARGSR